LSFIRKASFLLALFFFGLFSCQKELDFDLIDDVVVSPQGTLPLVNATLTLADLVSNVDTLLLIDPNEAMRVYYRQDSLFGYRANDLVKIPDQEPEVVKLGRNLPVLQVATTLGTLGGAEIDSVEIFKGIFEFSLASSDTLPDTTTVRLTIFNSDDKGSPFSVDLTLAPNDTLMLDSVQLDQVFFDLSNGGTRVNFLDVRLAILDPGKVPNGVDLDISFRLKDLEVERAVGFFGQRTEVAPSGSFDLGISGLENFAGGFLLNDPRVTLTITSTAGLPIQVNSNFTGVNVANQGVPLSPPNLNILAAANVNQPVVSTFRIDDLSSNIVAFLANIPNQVFYSAEAELNPAGRPAIPNFVDRNSQVVVDFEVDVPLELRLQDMRLDEVISDVEIGGVENPEFVESLTLFLLSENRLPFDMDLSVSFLDTLTGDSTGGFSIDFLQAAPVDGNGKVTGPNIFENEIVLNQEQIDALLGAGSIRIQAGVSTANDGSRLAKLYANDGLDVRIASKVKLNYNLSQQ
jgi:hypothetical protein